VTIKAEWKITMENYKRILVTSALPYANGPIHLGHLAGAYLPADVYVRYQRLQHRDVVYICGSDEHGVPITIAAEKQGIDPGEIVDRFHSQNIAAFEAFGMSFDYFGRTSSDIHHQTSQNFFKTLYDKGILKQKKEKQLYDPKAKMFLPDRYVKGTCPACSYPQAYGDQCEKCGASLSAAELIDPRSTISGEKPVKRETLHWFLSLGEFQDRLQTWLSGKKNWKSNVRGQVQSWLNDGLSDRAVTRDLSWGVPVPLEAARGKVLYVWFDAPIGYISATKEWALKKKSPDLWQRYWQDKETKLVHFIGKDNIVFHCIMFPAMLMAHEDYILPDNVPANEFLNLEGNKLSTSRNYAVWLEDYLKKFPADPLRYFLAINAPETKDTDFTWKEFQLRNNGELADILGNFINRTLSFAHQRFDGQVPNVYDLDDLDRAMLSLLKKAPTTIGDFLEQFELRKAASALIDVARDANKYFNDQAPWKSRNENPEKCATTIHICLQTAHQLALLMEPFMPFSALKLWKILNKEGALRAQHWDQLKPLKPGHNLAAPEILFNKIEDEDIEPEIERLKHAAPSETDEEEPLNIAPEIEFDAFGKIDLRVAMVKKAEKMPRADKLLKLLIELGSEERQIIAGVAQHYKPEQLIGKRIIVVANLKAAKIRGEKSEGMLLAAEDSDGSMAMLVPDKKIKTGAKIK
jgi:methionyl-tRNA synthetase